MTSIKNTSSENNLDQLGRSRPVSNGMNFFLILPYYLLWHYSQAFLDLKNIWKNFLVFLYNFFSIPTLIFSLFSPWQRMQESYSKNDLSFEGTFGNMIVNTIMRLVGAIARLLFIVIGIVSIILCLVLGVVIFCAWILLPFIIFYSISQGLIIVMS